MLYFTPARFGLYEFGDRLTGPAGRRFFGSFNGAVGEPAQNVTLGWSSDDATVLVCTSGSAPWDREDARSTAAHVALGGDRLPIPGRPASAFDTHAEMSRIASSDGSWSPAPGIVPGGTNGEAVAWDGFSLGYVHLAPGALFIAATGLGPGQLTAWLVRDWSAYDLDARTSFALAGT